MDGIVEIAHGRLREAVARVLVAAGATRADAQIVSDHLVDANLAGHDSHGVGMLPQYVRAIHSGVLDPRAHALLEGGGGAIVAADGRKGFGQVVAREAIAAGIDRARELGVALVALRNAFHIGRVGAYGEQAAAGGLASMHFANVIGHAPVVAPFGGRDARLATNPVCITLPGGARTEPFVLDFATSSLPVGKIRVALNRGERLPPGVLLDAHGVPTTDPAALFTDPRGTILPFGLHKGSGLALACELLAGALAGGGTLATVAPQPGRITNNLVSVLIDPGRMPGTERLGDEIDAALDHVKASPAIEASSPVLVAGEPERIARARRLAEGIPIERATWEELAEAARSVGIALEG